MNIREAVLWLQENFFRYMIPLCLLCVLRVAMCMMELKHMTRLREKKFVFRKVGGHYREIGLFVGLFVGFVLSCVLPLRAVWVALGVVLGVVGFKLGAKKGDEVDAFWREVIDEMAASADADKLDSAPAIDKSLGGFLDSLDVYEEEEDSVPVEALPAEEASENEEA